MVGDYFREFERAYISVCVGAQRCALLVWEGRKDVERIEVGLVLGFVMRLLISYYYCVVWLYRCMDGWEVVDCCVEGVIMYLSIY